MARKKKDDNHKVVRYNFSVQPSLFTWISAQEKKSTYIQRLVAQDILGLTFEEFVNSLYDSELEIANRSHPQDTLEQEYLRAAKWMVDGKVEAMYNTSDYVYLVITWRISGIKTIVGMRKQSMGFEHVLYDFTDYDIPEECSWSTLDTDDIKSQIAFRWKDVSDKLDADVEII